MFNKHFINLKLDNVKDAHNNYMSNEGGTLGLVTFTKLNAYQGLNEMHKISSKNLKKASHPSSITRFISFVSKLVCDYFGIKK